MCCVEDVIVATGCTHGGIGYGVSCMQDGIVVVVLLCMMYLYTTYCGVEYSRCLGSFWCPHGDYLMWELQGYALWIHDGWM